MRLLLLLACLGAVACATAPIMTPTDIDTCSNSTTDTAPQISRVQTCARASVTGYGVQTGISFATAHAQVLKVAASACGDAVAGSIGELCKGGDPMATIFNLASTCGAAMAAIYTRALTGSVVFDMSHKAAQGNVTSQGKLEACGSSCSTAQGAAQAFAQAAACGVAKATDNCIAATTHVKTRAFTHAFVKNTADSWGKACTSGTGMVTSGGATIAAAAAASIAKAMGLVAAQACANCPTCKCRKLDGLNLNDAGDFSAAAADVAAGRVGLAQSMATATTTFCTSNGTMEQAKSQARAVIATWSDLIIGAMGSVGGFAAASGNNSWACGSGSLTTELLAMRSVSGEVLADAGALVYGSWCPRAAAKFNNLELLTSEALQNITQRIAKRCTQTEGSGQAHHHFAEILTSSKPLVKKVAEALTEAKSCGCKKITCVWCKPGQAVATPLELANQFAPAATKKTPLLAFVLPGVGKRP